MSPARRACNWEQGEWARPAARRFGLIAAVTARLGNAWQARSRQRGAPSGVGALRQMTVNRIGSMHQSLISDR